MEEYLRMYKYSVFYSEEDGEYVGTCYEFPSLSAFGETSSEALEGIQGVVKDAVEILREDSMNIPMPLVERAYKGKILLRINPDTHRKVSEEALIRQLSVNQYLVSLIESNLYRQSIQQEIKKLSSELLGLHNAFEVMNNRIDEYLLIEKYPIQNIENFLNGISRDQIQTVPGGLHIVKDEDSGSALMEA